MKVRKFLDDDSPNFKHYICTRSRVKPGAEWRWMMYLSGSVVQLAKQEFRPPNGMVLVHNNVKPSRTLAARGFRAWVGEPGDHLVVCDCGWAPELGQHYIAATTAAFRAAEGRGETRRPRIA